MTTPSRTPIFTPSPGRLCVIPLEEESRGGILVVRNPNERPVRGTVSELPPGGTLEIESPLWQLRVGDTILFGSNSGLEIKVDGERRIILRESEVLAKVEWREEEERKEYTCAICNKPGFFTEIYVTTGIDGQFAHQSCFYPKAEIECPECGISRPNDGADCPNPNCVVGYLNSLNPDLVP